MHNQHYAAAHEAEQSGVQHQLQYQQQHHYHQYQEKTSSRASPWSSNEFKFSQNALCQHHSQYEQLVTCQHLPHQHSSPAQHPPFCRSDHLHHQLQQQQQQRSHCMEQHSHHLRALHEQLSALVGAAQQQLFVQQQSPCPDQGQHQGDGDVLWSLQQQIIHAGPQQLHSMQHLRSVPPPTEQSNTTQQQCTHELQQQHGKAHDSSGTDGPIRSDHKGPTLRWKPVLLRKKVKPVKAFNTHRTRQWTGTNFRLSHSSSSTSAAAALQVQGSSANNEATEDALAGVLNPAPLLSQPSNSTAVQWQQHCSNQSAGSSNDTADVAALQHTGDETANFIHAAADVRQGTAAPTDTAATTAPAVQISAADAISAHTAGSCGSSLLAANTLVTASPALSAASAKSCDNSSSSNCCVAGTLSTSTDEHSAFGVADVTAATPVRASLPGSADSAADEVAICKAFPVCASPARVSSLVEQLEQRLSTLQHLLQSPVDPAPEQCEDKQQLQQQRDAARGCYKQQGGCQQLCQLQHTVLSHRKSAVEQLLLLSPSTAPSAWGTTAEAGIQCSEIICLGGTCVSDAATQTPPRREHISRRAVGCQASTDSTKANSDPGPTVSAQAALAGVYVQQRQLRQHSDANAVHVPALRHDCNGSKQFSMANGKPANYSSKCYRASSDDDVAPAGSCRRQLQFDQTVQSTARNTAALQANMVAGSTKGTSAAQVIEQHNHCKVVGCGASALQCSVLDGTRSTKQAVVATKVSSANAMRRRQQTCLSLSRGGDAILKADECSQGLLFALMLASKKPAKNVAA